MGRIGFIGCGNMGSAILKGLLAKGVFEKEKFCVYDVSADITESLRNEGIACMNSIPELIYSSEVVILAVKPQFFDSISGTLKKYIDYHLVISIMAGITNSRLREGIGEKCRIIRTMPNTPLLAGAGMTAICAGDNVRDEDKALVSDIFGSLGKYFWTEEKYIDAVCGLSGSGPAYVALMIQAMADGGVYEGLPRDRALEMAAQTVYGTAKLVMEKNLHPEVLKDMVSSPGGTTIEGLKVLEEGNFRSSVMNAVIAGTEKSRNM